MTEDEARKAKDEKAPVKLESGKRIWRITSLYMSVGQGRGLSQAPTLCADLIHPSPKRHLYDIPVHRLRLVVV